MRKVASSFLVVVFFAFAAAAQSAGKTPESTIRGFYSWYIGEIAKNKFPLAQQPTRLKQFITTRCYNENKRAYDRNEFGADYFIAAQDFDEKWAANVKISNLKVNGSLATANVVLDGTGSFDSRLKLKLIKEKGLWKIDVIEGR
jgi:hypothetical protein